MEYESIKLITEFLSDAVKILGPAIITGLVAYKVGQFQLELKLKEITKNNEFKAREKVFEFHKTKLEENSKAMESLGNALGQFAGISLADYDDALKFRSLVNGLIMVHLVSLPYEFYNVESEFEKYNSEFEREKLRVEELKQQFSKLNRPETTEEALSVINELFVIYGFLGRCIRILIEKEALNIFSTYTKNT